MGLYRDKGSVNWYYRFTVAGHEIRGSTGTADRRAAQVEERRVRAYHDAQAPARRAGRGRGIADLAGLDIERAAAEGATKRHQAALLYQWAQITRLLGADAEPRTITYETVQRYVAARRSEGAMGQTIVRETQALKRACGEAHERGWMPVVPRRWPQIRREPAGAKRTGKLHPPAIIAQWLAALPQDARDRAEVAMLTSLRFAELGRITADWVEPAPIGAGVPAILRVPAASAKSRRERLIPLVGRVVEILRRRAEGVPTGAPLLPGRCRGDYERTSREIGYAATITDRDLRHTWATLAASTVGVDAARAVLGHSSLSTTSRYVHATLERSAVATLAVEGIVGRVGSAEQASRAIDSGDKAKESVGPMGDNPQLRKLLPSALDHVATCKTCLERALACANLSLVDGQDGRGDSAEVKRHATPGTRR